MKQYKKFGAFTSSANPEEFSLTIASAIKIIGSIVGGMLSLKGINFSIDDNQVKALADAFTIIATSSVAIWHAGNVVYGFIRKLSFKKF